MGLADQVITQIRNSLEDLNKLKYGEITLTVQDGKLVKMDIRKSIKIQTDSNNERSRGA